ncbi:MAG: DUF1858 domain-containing protein [Candidatus Anstonellaceae archaeon]
MKKSKLENIMVPKISKKKQKNQKVEFANLDKLGLEDYKPLNKITKNTLIVEIVLNYPELAEELMEIGFHCIGCPASSFETIYEGCLVHGLNEKEIEAFIKKLNEKIKEIKKEKTKQKGKIKGEKNV